MANKAEDATALRKLSGGGWQSRDGRFTIEQQSGRWVVLDAEQTDELGLPRVRGPYPSLKVAKATVEEIRAEPAAESPLADRLREAKTRPRPRADAPAAGGTRRRAARSERDDTPPEPDWLVELPSDDRDRARQLVRDLESAGVADAQALVRRDVVDGEPAIAERLLGLAIARRVGVLRGQTPAQAIADVVSWITTHAHDPELPMRLPGWRVVEDPPGSRRLEISRKALLAAIHGSPAGGPG